MKKILQITRNNKPVLGNKFTVLAIILVSTLATVGMTYVLYTTMQSVFRANLDERLESIAATAALNFNPKDLNEITGPDSVDNPAYKNAVGLLQNIRKHVPNIQYAYILRRTDRADMMEYVADADSIDPEAEIDLNQDGVINEEDALVYPTEEYDVSDFPDFAENAFLKPFVDPDFTVSQWGVFLSGTAPIRNEGDSARLSNYAIGLDLNVTQYQYLLNQIIFPFIAYAVVLLSFIFLQAFALRDRWKKEVMQLADLDRQKDELLGLVSHQLATPVSSIKWYLEMLKDGDLGPLNKEQAEHITSMYSIGENMSDLVSMILDVSRIQLGRMRIEKQELDLNVFFHDIMNTIEPKALEKKIVFLKNIPERLPVAQLDRRYTNMTIENLLSNAVKYTPEGGKVTCDVKIESGMVLVTVADTGMGIPQEEQSKIFGRMFRASNARNAIDGNGFGLFVAKGAVEEQGGKIWFESTEGKGTTFYVQLPLKN